jgi:hypothetical protein
MKARNIYKTVVPRPFEIYSWEEERIHPYRKINRFLAMHCNGKQTTERMNVNEAKSLVGHAEEKNYALSL